LFSDAYTALVAAPRILGRVTACDRGSFLVLTASGEFRATLRGVLLHRAGSSEALVAVGDYVAVLVANGGAVIEGVLPRANLFARRAAGSAGGVQAIAANLDWLFVVLALNRDFNMRRVERYLLAANGYGVPAAVVLTKRDLVDEVTPFVVAAEAVAGDAPVLSVSALDGSIATTFAPFLGSGKTLAFVGSSGAGKSTIMNALAGDERFAVGAARDDDDRGRHTTTRREIVRLDDGTWIVDTPGMREFGLVAHDEDDSFAMTFDDVAAVAENCRFSDCAHETEPGCAVRESVDPQRLAGWQKLRREAAHELRKSDVRAALAEKRRWKTIHKANRRRESMR
jgi:ribosome biogenesis GTPase / thiamine phosphate phosphatase